VIINEPKSSGDYVNILICFDLHEIKKLDISFEYL